MDDERDESVLRDAFAAGQIEVLGLIATGRALGDVLTEVVRLIERAAVSNNMACSILRLDADGRLSCAAAPSLPRAYLDALEGARIGPTEGACGAAAFHKERVIVEDIATHPNWIAYRDLALPHGLRACWSTPIFSPQRDVLGTFAMYYREPRTPTAAELAWVDERRASPRSPSCASTQQRSDGRSSPRSANA